MILHLRKYEELTADELVDWGGGYQGDSGDSDYGGSTGSGGSGGYGSSSGDTTGSLDKDDDLTHKGDDGITNEDDDEGYQRTSGGDDGDAELFDQREFSGDFEGYAYSCYAVSTINGFQTSGGDSLSKSEAVEVLEEAERRGYYDSETGMTNQSGLWEMLSERSDELEGKKIGGASEVSTESEFREAVSRDYKAATVVFEVEEGGYTHSVSLHGDSLSDIEDPFYEDGRFDYGDIVEVRFFD